MKSIFVSALVASLSIGQVASAGDCLNIFQIAKEEGKFPEGQYTLDDGNIVTLSLTDFWSTSRPPTATMGFARVVEMDCFGGPRSVQLGNISLMMHIDRNVSGSSKINVNFCDYGGHENVSARQAAPADFIDNMPNVVGKELPDENGNPVQMDVSWGQPIVNSGGIQVATTGKLIFEAKEPLETIVVGGQELFIHSICLND